MDKDYLLHNIKINDSGYDHSTMDIGLKLKDVDEDVIADVTISYHTVMSSDGTIQEGNNTTVYEDVSLTGAGGGSGGFKIVSITAVNEGTTTVKITCPQLYSDPTNIYSGEISIMRGTTTQFNTIVPIADGDGYTTILMPTVPNDFTDGIQQSGPTFKITENASDETITWG